MPRGAEPRGHRTCRGPAESPAPAPPRPKPAGGSRGPRRPLTWPRGALRLRARGGLRARAAPAAEPGGGRSHPVLAAAAPAGGGGPSAPTAGPAPPAQGRPRRPPPPRRLSGGAAPPAPPPAPASASSPRSGTAVGGGGRGRGRGRSPAGLGGAGGGQAVTKPPARQGMRPPRRRRGCGAAAQAAVQRPARCREPRPALGSARRAPARSPRNEQMGRAGEQRSPCGAGETLLRLLHCYRYWRASATEVVLWNAGVFLSHTQLSALTAIGVISVSVSQPSPFPLCQLPVCFKAVRCRQLYIPYFVGNFTWALSITMSSGFFSKENVVTKKTTNEMKT